jgi:hypothetical protein
MVSNRSVPADVILPHINYRNVAEASRWLTAMFDFEEHQRAAGLATLATRRGSPVPVSVTSRR